MTDVLIKNWCIPKCCMDCDPDFAYAIKCEAYNENNDFTRQRAENCPLAEIKHSQDGDTISREEVLENINERINAHIRSGGDCVGIIHEMNRLYGYVLQIPSAEKLQPRVETSDLINRADAIDAVRSCKFHAIKGSLQTAPWYEAINEVFEILSALPSAEAVSREEYDQLEALYDAIRIYDSSAEAVKVAYICDGRKCDSDCGECFRTLDIEHARDFKLMGDTYFQQEAEADPTVIRSRTLMPTKDFKEWAKRVREENPNVIVIPCDAEVASADAVQGECRTCGRNADNGGVHEDGRTKCPIQEHYALPLDGYCHLYEPYKGGDSE